MAECLVAEEQKLRVKAGERHDQENRRGIGEGKEMRGREMR